MKLILKLVRSNLNYRVLETSTAAIFFQMIILSIAIFTVFVQIRVH